MFPPEAEFCPLLSYTSLFFNYHSVWTSLLKLCNDRRTSVLGPLRRSWTYWSLGIPKLEARNPSGYGAECWIEV
jgi:hypothetical protein